MSETHWADDLVRGVPAISREIRETPRRTYFLLETGQIPGFKTEKGKTWHAFRSKLRQHYERLAGGGAA